MNLRQVFAASIFALTAFAGTAANADTFDWTFTDNSNVVVASGVLVTDAPTVVGSQTVFPVLSGTGSVFGVDGFSADSSLSIFGTYSAPLSYNQIGNQTYDNALYLGLPYVDGNGLEFASSSSVYYNIYNDVNTGGYGPGNYPNHDIFWIDGGATVTGTFNIAAISEVPEPFTLSVFGIGLVGAAAARRRAKKAA